MEKRVVLATGISIAIFLLWMAVVQPLLFPPKPRPPGPVQPETAPARRDEEPGWSDLKRPDPPAVPVVREPDLPVRNDLVLENKVLRVVFTNRGAGILTAHVHLAGRPEPFAVLKPYDAELPHLALVSAEAADKLDTAVWSHDDREAAKGKLIFSRTLLNGLKMEKQFTLDPDQHLLRLKIYATNEPGREPQNVQFELAAFNGMPHDSEYRTEAYSRGIVVMSQAGSSKISYVSLADVIKNPPPSFKNPEIDGCGLRNRYFALGLLPDSESTRASMETVAFSPMLAEQQRNTRIRIAMPQTQVRGSQVWEYSLFAGPVTSDALKPVGHGYEQLAAYGESCFILAPIVGWVAPALAWLMTVCARLVGNFGFGIILMTLGVRLCLFPLSRKSTVSLARMSEISPKMALIRERYKSDPQKQQAETMKLFKESGVNPLSGCLPMMMQLPIWIGVYSVIDTSFVLRQEPFILWIRDLSQPDRLAPHILGTYDLNLLPIIMTVMWFLQSYFAPRNPDPQMAMQQKMMLIMPVVMGLMCYTLASGLSLYFLVNSLLALAEQKIIKKLWLKPKTA